jgi:hypothetical protein
LLLLLLLATRRPRLGLPTLLLLTGLGLVALASLAARLPGPLLAGLEVLLLLLLVLLVLAMLGLASLLAVGRRPLRPPDLPVVGPLQVTALLGLPPLELLAVALCLLSPLPLPVVVGIALALGVPRCASARTRSDCSRIWASRRSRPASCWRFCCWARAAACCWRCFS